MKNLNGVTANRLLLAVALCAASTVALADPPAAPDTAAAVTYINTNGPVVMSAIGGAMTIMSVVAILWKWAKAAVFG